MLGLGCENAGDLGYYHMTYKTKHTNISNPYDLQKSSIQYLPCEDGHVEVPVDKAYYMGDKCAYPWFRYS